MPTQFHLLHALRRAPVPPTTKLVGYVLASLMTRDGVCTPALSVLADGAGVSERTARRALRALESAGLIVVEPHRGRPSTYRTGDTAMSPHPGHSYDRTPRTPSVDGSRKTPATAVAGYLEVHNPTHARTRTVADMTDDEYVSWVESQRGRPDVR